MEENDKLKCFTIFHNLAKSIAELPDEHLPMFYRAFYNYAYWGKMPDFSDNVMLKVLWSAVFELLQETRENALKKVKAGKAGKGRSRNKGNKNAAKLIDCDDDCDENQEPAANQQPTSSREYKDPKKMKPDKEPKPLEDLCLILKKDAHYRKALCEHIKNKFGFSLKKSDLNKYTDDFCIYLNAGGIEWKTLNDAKKHLRSYIEKVLNNTKPAATPSSYEAPPKDFSIYDQELPKDFKPLL